MILTFNIGNTNFSIGIMERCEKPLIFTQKYTIDSLVDERMFTDYIADCLKQARTTIEEIEGAIISSVNPLLTPYLENVILNLLKVKPVIVNPNMNMKLDLSEYDTSLLGNDRIAICEGALSKYDSPIIIFDFGTATTINVIDKYGCFLGGSILPGIVMGLNALNSNTAQLPLGELKSIGLNDEIPLIGKNTKECIMSGAILGNAAMLDDMVLRIQELFLEEQQASRESQESSPAATSMKKRSIPTYITGTTTSSILAAIAPDNLPNAFDTDGDDITILVTGGNAQYILPHIKTNAIHAPDLLMDGLHELYKLNNERKMCS